MVTFLFTDIEGSTRLWERHPVAMREALARHDAILNQAIAEHSGEVFKTIGDAFCAAFERPADALRAARDIQIRLAREAWEEVDSLRVRIAVYTGEAVERAGDFFGPTLNRVSRILAVGSGGQILVSGSTVEMLDEATAKEMELRRLGVFRLRDLLKPEELYQMAGPGLPQDFASIRGLESTPNNLPLQLTAFVGREKELEEIDDLLRQSRLLTLVGTGGCGKTRLALQLAADVLDRFSDGVWFVELAAVGDPEHVARAIAAAASIPDIPGKTHDEVLAENLRARTTLLVIDNCEHLIEGVAKVADAVLKRCPTVQILATSREALGLAGETIWRVPSLSLPPENSQLKATEAERYESVKLFLDRAKTANAAFCMSDDSSGVIAQICRRLDGIPLAIELAAARVKTLPVEQLLMRLNDRFRLLTGGSRTALQRHQTLRATIDWSYDLLDSHEATMWRCMSVFSGGWSLEAAEAMHRNTPIEIWEVLDLLEHLVDKSLVSVDPEGRYRMNETIRQYGRDRLHELGLISTMRDRHAAFFREMVALSRPHLNGAEQANWMNRLEADHENIRAALDWLASAADPMPAVEMASALWIYWATRGFLREGRDRLSSLLELGQNANIDDELAEAYYALGRMEFFLGNITRTMALEHDALKRFRAKGDKQGEGDALSTLAFASITDEKFDQAKLYLDESIGVYRALGDLSGEARALTIMGVQLQRTGEPDSARAALKRALDIRAKIKERRAVGITLSYLAQLEDAENRSEEAEHYFSEALKAYREIGDRRLVAFTLSSLGTIWIKRGDFDRAFSANVEAFEILREIRDSIGIVFALGSLAQLAAAKSQWKRAAILFGAAETMKGEGAPVWTPESLRELQDAMEDARLHLGDDAYHSALQEGAGLDVEAVHEYALAPPDRLERS